MADGRISAIAFRRPGRGGIEFHLRALDLHAGTRQYRFVIGKAFGSNWHAPDR